MPSWMFGATRLANDMVRADDVYRGVSDAGTIVEVSVENYERYEKYNPDARHASWWLMYHWTLVENRLK